MSTRPALLRGLKVAAGLLVVQALLVGAFLFVRSRREAPAGAPIIEALTPTTLPPLALTTAAGPAPLLRRGPLLLHFWATWCAPCRAELPELLALDANDDPDEGDVDVIAVSVDERWALLEHHFAGPVPAQVRRLDASVARDALGVDALPVTFLIDAHGRVVARAVGAQPWGSAQTKALLAAWFEPGGLGVSPREPGVRSE